MTITHPIKLYKCILIAQLLSLPIFFFLSKDFQLLLQMGQFLYSIVIYENLKIFSQNINSKLYLSNYFIYPTCVQMFLTFFFSFIFYWSEESLIYIILYLINFFFSPIAVLILVKCYLLNKG